MEFAKAAGDTASTPRVIFRVKTDKGVPGMVLSGSEELEYTVLDGFKVKITRIQNKSNGLYIVDLQEVGGDVNMSAVFSLKESHSWSFRQFI
jgi:hypothetical protein